MKEGPGFPGPILTFDYLAFPNHAEVRFTQALCSRLWTISGLNRGPTGYEPGALTN